MRPGCAAFGQIYGSMAKNAVRISRLGAHYSNVTTDLERSHDELRAALIVAGRHIRKFRYAKGRVRTLSTLRKVLRDARQVRKTKQD